jgi:hypothetical protein
MELNRISNPNALSSSSLQTHPIIKCTLRFEYDNTKIANAIMAAVAVDNYEFVKVNLETSTLISKIESRTILSLLHTLEDYLACVNVAEKLAIAIAKSSR